jgi:hypothetical protein
MSYTNDGEKVFARDLSPNFKTEGEVTNLDAINNAVENLIMTFTTERLFNHIGTQLPVRVFGNVTPQTISDVELSINTVLSTFAVHLDMARTNVQVKYIPGNKAIYIRVEYYTKSSVRGEFYSKHEVVG